MLKDKVKKYRTDNGLSQQALADKLGISRGYVSDIESGKVKGNVKLLKKLSFVSGLGFEYWSDVDIENNYSNLEALDTLLDTLIDAKVITSDEIQPEIMESIVRVLKQEIKYKLSKKRKGLI